MATPTLVTVTGHIEGRGAVVFTRRRALISAVDNSVIPVPARPVTAVLDDNGDFTIALYATNDPDWLPLDWSYSVRINAGGGAQGSMQLDYQNTDVDFDDVFSIDTPAVQGVSSVSSVNGRTGAVTLEAQNIPLDSTGYQVIDAADVQVAFDQADAALAELNAQAFPVAVGGSIQTAITAAATAGGGIVQLANGTHTIASTLIVPVAAPVVIRGGGSSNCRLSAAAGLNGPVIRSENFSSLTGTQPVDPTLTASGPNGFTIEGVEIIGNQASQATGWGIQLFGYGYTLRDVVIRDCKSGGLYTEFAHSGSYASTAKGVESRFYDLQIHHNGGNGWEMRGPNDSRAVGCLIWENSGIGFWAKTTAGASSANGVNLINCHVYGSAHTTGMLWDAQVFAAQCQSEGVGSGGYQLVVRYSDCVWVGGSIYDINPAGGNGGGIQVGDAGTSTFAVRFHFFGDINGFKGDTVAHSAINFSASSNSFIQARIGMVTSAANAIAGTPDISDVLNLAVSGGGATAANSLTRLRGPARVDAGSSAIAFVVTNGTTNALVVDTANKLASLANGAVLRGYSDALATKKFELDGAKGHIEFTSTVVPTLGAGVALGTSPPSPQIDATSNDQRGIVNFGTGTGPSTGNAVTVTFTNPYSRAPVVMLIGKNGAAQALNLSLGAVTAGGFNINVNVAPAASQAATTYYVAYMVMG